MKILFLGSIPDHKPESGQKPKPEHKAMFSAAYELGQEAANLNHTILIGSDSPNTIDYYIAKGVIEFCEENKDQKRIMEIHRPNDSKSPYESSPDNLEILRLYYHQDDSNPHKWIVTHMRALDSCDCLITLGGGVSTRIVGNIAADRVTPIVAISVFGGTSSELFDRLHYNYKNIIENKSILKSLVTPWESSSPKNILAIAEILSTSPKTNPYLYFISYSWDDSEKADHIEALLRRNNRNVLRDENNVKTGGRLSTAIESLIKQSDTFIALLSEKYSNSTWCPHELEYAINQKSKTGKPLRIILCSLDDTPVPIRATDSLRCQGQDRTQRELSILHLLREE